MKLLFNALTKLLLGLILIGAMLFWPAGTFDYPGAWTFIGALFLPMLIMGTVMLIKSPDLLERRLDSKEKQSAQRLVVALSGLMFPIGFILSAFDFKLGLSSVPSWASIAATAVFLLGYALYAEVMRENAYLSRTVKVQEGQKLISTGLYGIVRHPMYLATLLMFLPIPIILSSFWGLIPFALYPIIIIIRILDEERLLCEELAGYKEYKTKTKYRLIPFIW